MNNTLSVSKTHNRLKNFPITFFAIALGFAGFTLAVQKTEELFLKSSIGSTSLLIITLGIFGVVSLCYLAKTIWFFDDVLDEIKSPVKINFFPLVAKILLVLSVVFLSRNMLVSKYFWIVGTLLQFVASLAIMSTWINHTHFKIEHLTPGWFIPIVGFVIVPIAGVSHGFVELSWFFFSIGLVFWLALFIIVFYRMVFHEPIVQKLLPTLFILFAPPAIAFIAWSKLTGHLDPFGRILFYTSLFSFMLVLYRANIFLKIQFFLSWWAYSFPLAAITLASIQMYHFAGTVFYRNLIFFNLSLLVVAVVLLSIITIVNIVRKKICVEES
ncbi:MAG: SLAC1 anion channel family protein [Chitinispirillaceae bacterium]|nr:SLAC1 anion channel family protein [Chitinispirillaceae bacterium]